MPSSQSHVCFPEEKSTPPLFQNGRLVLQNYNIAFIIIGCFAIISSAVSFWLVNKHLQWYHNKLEQRYIVRILFMVPIYALVSFASFVYWNHSTALTLIRDGYESTVLTAFFYLLLLYLDHDQDQQKAIFLRLGLSREADGEAQRRKKSPRKWIFPLGFVKWKPHDGLLFLQLMKWGVLQYCVIRPVTTFLAVMLNYFGLYCEESWMPWWGHIYISVIVSISVSIAMYCLIQLYLPVAKILAPHKPLLKLFAVKAVVFLTFWQATFLGILSMFNVVKETQYLTAADVNVGIEAFIETFEMMLFAFLHVYAFTYKPYQHLGIEVPGYPPERTPRWRSLGHAMDFRETFREIWVGIVYIFSKMRGKEPTIDVKTRRDADYEKAFGRSRMIPDRAELEESGASPEKPGATLPNIGVEVHHDVMVDIEGERQWLGTGDDYAYGLGYMKKERSDSLGVQIGKEMEKRGFQWEYDALPIPRRAKPRHVREPSLWRRIFNRIVVRGSDRGSGGLESPFPSQDQERRRDLSIEDPPPPSILSSYRGRETNICPHGLNASIHVPTPMPVTESRRPRNSRCSNYPHLFNDVPALYTTAYPRHVVTSVGGLDGHHVIDDSVDEFTMPFEEVARTQEYHPPFNGQEQNQSPSSSGDPSRQRFEQASRHDHYFTPPSTNFRPNVQPPTIIHHQQHFTVESSAKQFYGSRTGGRGLRPGT